ncbi:MAG TPA: preprotein translocase subunit YajC [Actinomycetota bacterium]
MLAANSGAGAQLILFALLFAVIYFLMIRPQRRRAQQQASLQRSLELGDEVMTVSGFLGTIRRFDGETVTLELSPGVEVRVVRRAISGKVQPSEPEAEELDEHLGLDGHDHQHDDEAGNPGT